MDYGEIIMDQVTRSEAHVPAILKETLKFSLQRGHKSIKTPSHQVSRFSPHAFHLEGKIEVFTAEGSPRAAAKQLTYFENEIL